MDQTVQVLSDKKRQDIVRQIYNDHPYLLHYQHKGPRCLHCERITIEERYGVEAKKAWITLRMLGER